MIAAQATLEAERSTYKVQEALAPLIQIVIAHARSQQQRRTEHGERVARVYIHAAKAAAQVNYAARTERIGLRGHGNCLELDGGAMAPIHCRRQIQIREQRALIDQAHLLLAQILARVVGKRAGARLSGIRIQLGLRKT